MLFEALHIATEVVGIGYLQTSTTGLQALCLLETLVVGTKENRNIPDGSFQGVVDTHTKASTHIGHVGIVVDAAEQAEAIDNQHFCILER